MAICINIHLIPHILFFVINTTLIAACIYSIYKFIEMYKVSAMPHASLLFWMGLFYISLTLIYGILWIILLIVALFSCWKFNVFIEAIIGLTWTFNTYTLLVLLFIRVYVVFKGSLFQLSSCITRTVISAFLITLSLVIVLAIPIWKTDNLWQIRNLFFALIFLLTIVYCIWITTFFIYKLYQVFKAAELKDDHLLPTITKNTVLAIFSIAVTFLAIIVWITSPTTQKRRENDFAHYIYYFIFLLNLYVNFITSMLMYGTFKPYYDKLCGCIDSKCKSCCIRMIQNTSSDERNTVENLNVGSSIILYICWVILLNISVTMNLFVTKTNNLP
eukprot:479096_1